MAVSDQGAVGDDDDTSLREQLQLTKVAADNLATAVDGLSDSMRISRFVYIGLTILGVITLLLVLAVGALSFWVYSEQKDVDNDLRQFGRDLFLSGCEAQNAGRQRLRENSLAETEDLIDIFNADELEPEAAAEARRLAEERNAENPDRDCIGELRELEQ